MKKPLQNRCHPDFDTMESRQLATVGLAAHALAASAKASTITTYAVTDLANATTGTLVVEAVGKGDSPRKLTIASDTIAVVYTPVKPGVTPVFAFWFNSSGTGKRAKNVTERVTTFTMLPFAGDAKPTMLTAAPIHIFSESADGTIAVR